jgi:D-apiose dehydrogenase
MPSWQRSITSVPELRPPLRVACIGAGYFSRFHHDAWRRLGAVDLAAICDLDPARAAQAAAASCVARWFTDAAAMLDAVAPDLVDIATPPPTHLPLIALAAQRGIPAIVQKPFCGSLAEAEKAVKIAKAASIPLVVHENFRFQPWYREAHRLLRAGVLGEPYSVTFRLRPGDGNGPRAYLDRQPYFQTMPRFLVHETAIHLIDVFRFLFGEIVSVYADLRRLNPVIAGEDAGYLLFRHADAARSLFDGNRLADHPARDRRLTMGEMVLEGAEASLRLDGNGGLFLRPSGANEERAMLFARSDHGFGGDSVFALQNHVVSHLLQGTPLENTGRDYLANLRIEEASYCSAELGQRVCLPLPVEGP